MHSGLDDASWSGPGGAGAGATPPNESDQTGLLGLLTSETDTDRSHPPGTEPGSHPAYADDDTLLSPPAGRDNEPPAVRNNLQLAELAALDADLVELETLPHKRRSAASTLAGAAAERARALGAVDMELRAQLVQADTIARQGRTAAATRIMREVNRWATEHHHRYLLARSHRHLAQLVRTIGDYPTALEHAVRAVELTAPDMPPPVRIDHLLTLATVLARIGDYDAATARFAAAEREVVAYGDHEMLIALLNNVAYMNYEAGRIPQALTAARRMQSQARRYRIPMATSFTDTLARCLLAAGQPAEAIAAVQEVLKNPEEVPEADAVAECLLTLAQAQQALGQLDEALAALNECEHISTTRQLTEVLPRVYEVRAALFAAQGAYREAYEEHQRYSAAAARLSSHERDGRARVIQAVFETNEARRDTERFRYLSLHDPLTGLYNRRHVDEQLPQLITVAERTDTAVSVALLDLDHFKRINDTCSHEAGDAVLATVGGLLQRTGPPGSFAARLGGEEFLLVLPETDNAAAVAVCRDLQARLHAQDWRPVTGALAVTASFGIATTGAQTATQLTLLRRADTHLHSAKTTGRDRIVTD